MLEEIQYQPIFLLYVSSSALISQLYNFLLFNQASLLSY